MLITISGPAGSGKSTAAAALADRLDDDHVSGGDIFRELADEKGLTPLELNKRAEEDDTIDRDLDRRLREVAAEREEKSVDLARRETQERADSEARRYQDYYGIDIANLEIYDLVLNTARLDSEGVVDAIATVVEAYEPEGDEGKTPVAVDYEF